MALEGVIEVRPNVSFEILVAKMTRTTVYVPKHQVLYSISDRTVNIIDPEQVVKESRCTIVIEQAVPKPPVQENEQANTPTTSKDWSDTINIPP